MNATESVQAFLARMRTPQGQALQNTRWAAVMAAAEQADARRIRKPRSLFAFVRRRDGSTASLFTDGTCATSPPRARARGGDKALKSSNPKVREMANRIAASARRVEFEKILKACGLQPRTRTRR